MSINFSEDVNDEIITTAASLPEDNSEGSLRPKTISEYIGQEKAKDNLSIFINAAKMSANRLITYCSTVPRGLERRRLPRSSQMRWA